MMIGNIKRTTANSENEEGVQVVDGILRDHITNKRGIEENLYYSLSRLGYRNITIHTLQSLVIISYVPTLSTNTILYLLI